MRNDGEPALDEYRDQVLLHATFRSTRVWSNNNSETNARLQFQAHT
jgi:hypothetical protein